MEGLVLKRKMNIFYLKLGISREVKGSKQGLWSLEAADVLTKTIGRRERGPQTARQPTESGKGVARVAVVQQQPGRIQQCGR